MIQRNLLLPSSEQKSLPHDTKSQTIIILIYSPVSSVIKNFHETFKYCSNFDLEWLLKRRENTLTAA
jgi:hypothetical protein